MSATNPRLFGQASPGPDGQPKIPEWWQWPLPPLGGIERLPTFFGERQIKFRSPFSMPAEKLVAFDQAGIPTQLLSDAFPDSAFLQNTDKPFEVHRMIARVTLLDDHDPQQVIFLTEDQYKALLRCVRVRVNDVSKDQLITKNSQLLSDLLNESTGTWEWYDPYTISRSEGFNVAFDILPFNVTSLGLPQGVTAASLRLEVTFEGYLIVIAPPTNER